MKSTNTTTITTLSTDRDSIASPGSNSPLFSENNDSPKRSSFQLALIALAETECNQTNDHNNQSPFVKLYIILRDFIHYVMIENTRKYSSI